VPNRSRTAEPSPHCAKPFPHCANRSRTVAQSRPVSRNVLTVNSRANRSLYSVLQVRLGLIFVTPLSRANGTFLGGQRLMCDVAYPVAEGSVLGLGAAAGTAVEGSVLGLGAAAGTAVHVAVHRVGPARCCSPRHRMPLDSRDEGSECVG